MPLSAVAVAILADEVGIPRSQLATAVAIAWAESGLDTNATGHNGVTYGCPNGSRDRGLWQINDCYHADVSDKCAYDPFCNAQAMVRISSHGSNWHPWSTYNSGAYTRYLAAAQIAVNQVATGTAPGSQPSSGFNPVEYAIALAKSGANPWDTLVKTMQQIFAHVQSQI